MTHRDHEPAHPGPPNQPVIPADPFCECFCARLEQGMTEAEALDACHNVPGAPARVEDIECVCRIR